ncbi:MAG: Uma2 family endonuclease [Hydrococcus sp. Prado102]|jgi:Uma2 family endonuclease|nr:Uma2 family endonuclease [Hydrococcus sp. Prado102]
MLINSSSKTYTLDEYRALEETAEFKSEYHDGAIIPMSGGTINHNRIVRNLIRILDTALRQQPYEVFSSDLRLWVPPHRKGLYPDVMVIAGEPVLNEQRTDEILNPCLIVEVLSKSTSGYDRGDKFLYYRSIPQFQEYLLVSQSEYFIEHYVKTGENQWLLREYRGSDTQIELSSVGVTIVIRDLYEGVNFELPE